MPHPPFGLPPCVSKRRLVALSRCPDAHCILPPSAIGWNGTKVGNATHRDVPVKFPGQKTPRVQAGRGPRPTTADTVVCGFYLSRVRNTLTFVPGWMCVSNGSCAALWSAYIRFASSTPPVKHLTEPCHGLCHVMTRFAIRAGSSSLEENLRVKSDQVSPRHTTPFISRGLALLNFSPIRTGFSLKAPNKTGKVSSIKSGPDMLRLRQPRRAKTYTVVTAYAGWMRRRRSQKGKLIMMGKRRHGPVEIMVGCPGAASRKQTELKLPGTITPILPATAEPELGERRYPNGHVSSLPPRLPALSFETLRALSSNSGCEE